MLYAVLAAVVLRLVEVFKLGQQYSKGGDLFLKYAYVSLDHLVPVIHKIGGKCVFVFSLFRCSLLSANHDLASRNVHCVNTFTLYIYFVCK